MKKRTGKQAFRVLALSLGLAGMLHLSAFAGQTISNGVFIQGMDCSGLSAEDATQMINTRIAELSQTTVNVNVGDQTASFTLQDLGFKWSNKDIVNQAMNLGSTGNIVQRYMDQKDLEHNNREFRLRFDADETLVGDYASSLIVYNTDPVNATIYTTDQLTPGVDGGTDGITVDVEGAKQTIMTALRSWDGASPLNVTIPVERKEPDVTYDDLAVICDVLGTATTDYSASSYARATNVENGCRKITGTLLYPGDEFSVTAAVTPFTAENGYEQAPSYEENRVVDSYGGGICQVSTTLYNAVLKSELDVTARSNHTMVVTYVSLSKDAAIAEGVMDFAFVNNKEDPIYIIGYTYGGTITFTIYGRETRPSNRTLEFESRTIQTIEPSGAKLYANTSQNVGYVYQTQSAHTGYTAELWKNIYIDGVLTDSYQINSSYYTAVGVIYDIGVASSNAAVTQAMYTAISSGDLSQVQQVISSANTIAQQAQQQQQQVVQVDGQTQSGTVDAGTGDYDE